MLEQDLINKYLGIPFKHKGRTLEGLDCWGLVIRVFAEIKIKILDINNYSENWSLQGKNYFMERYYKKWIKLRKTEKFEFLDVLLIDNYKGIPFHSGIYLSKGKFIHASKAGVVVGKITDKRWGNRIHGVYRYGNSKINS